MKGKVALITNRKIQKGQRPHSQSRSQPEASETTASFPPVVTQHLVWKTRGGGGVPSHLCFVVPTMPAFPYFKTGFHSR